MFTGTRGRPVLHQRKLILCQLVAISSVRLTAFYPVGVSKTRDCCAGEETLALAAVGRDVFR